MKKYLTIISKKYYYKVLLLTVFIIISGFLEMIGIGTIVLFVNSILSESVDYYLYINNLFNVQIDEKFFSTINIAFALAAIFIIKNLFVFFVKIFEHFVTYKIKINNNNKIFRLYVNSSYLEHKEFKSSDLTRNIVTDNAQAATYIQNQIIIIREMFIALAILCLLIMSNTSMILATFGFLYLVSYIFISLIKKKLNLFGKLIFEARSRILEVLNNLFLGVKDIKLLKIESFIQNQFFKNDKEAQKSQFYYDVYQSAPRLFIEIMIVLIIFAVALKFNFAKVDNQNLATSLSLLGASFIRLLPAFSAITTAISKNKFLRPSLEIIYNEVTKSEIFFANKVEGKNLEIEKFNNIIFKNVKYKYPKQNDFLFENLNLEIYKNDIFCISGPSGQGKTTICDLITNLIEPNEGEILINGIKNIDISPKSFKKMISFVTQKPFFKEGLIKESLLYGVEDQNTLDLDIDKYIIEVFKIIKLDELIDTSNNSLKKIFVSKLSGGQLQRLGLARAIMKKPQLLILDEGTNALDLNLEKEIFANIKKFVKDITIILISHRNETKDFANRVYDIKNNNN